MVDTGWRFRSSLELPFCVAARASHPGIAVAAVVAVAVAVAAAAVVVAGAAAAAGSLAGGRVALV